jgi:hypothetical protein
VLIGGIYSLDRIDQPPGPVHDLAMLLTRVVNRAAMRLRDPTPVRVAVVATLVRPSQDESSPVFVGGNAPADLADIAARCRSPISPDRERI